MSEKLRKKLAIDEYLQLIKEDKNLNMAYTSLSQYMNSLEHQLEEKDKVIDEIEKRCNQEISSAMIQYERHKRNDTWQYIIAHKRILEILEKIEIKNKNYKNDN